MKRIICTIVKYLMWALLIIAALLYMSGFDVRQQAMVILIGTVAIDLVFAVGLAVSDFAASRRKKAFALQKTAEKAVGIKRGKGKGKKSASPAPSAAKAGQGSDAVLESVKDAGSAIKTAAETTWGAIKEKSGEMTAAIKDKIGTEE